MNVLMMWYNVGFEWSYHTVYVSWHISWGCQEDP